MVLAKASSLAGHGGRGGDGLWKRRRYGDPDKFEFTSRLHEVHLRVHQTAWLGFLSFLEWSLKEAAWVEMMFHENDQVDD
jgi:hypothetical protein